MNCKDDCRCPRYRKVCYSMDYNRYTHKFDVPVYTEAMSTDCIDQFEEWFTQKYLPVKGKQIECNKYICIELANAFTDTLIFRFYNPEHFRIVDGVKVHHTQCLLEALKDSGHLFPILDSCMYYLSEEQRKEFLYKMYSEYQANVGQLKWNDFSKYEYKKVYRE